MNFSSISGEKVDKIKSGVAHTSNPLVPSPAVLAHAQAPTTRHKPRVISDSAIIPSKSRDDFSSTFQELARGSRQQRNLSVGCHPHPTSTQSLKSGFANPVPPELENSTGSFSGYDEAFENYFRAFQDPPDSEPGSTYDGTQPIAYIQVNNPQRYLAQPTRDVPGPHTHNLWPSQETTIKKAHASTHGIHSQPDDQELITDQGICPQRPTVHDRNWNQPSSHISTSNSCPHLDLQPTHPSNSSLGYCQSSSQPGMVPVDEVKDESVNKRHPTTTHCDMPTLASAENQDPHPQSPNRYWTRSGISSSDETTARKYNNSIHSVAYIYPGAASASHGPSLSGMDRALGTLQNVLQGQILVENSADYTPAPTPDRITHHEKDLITYPTVDNPRSSPSNQPALNCRPTPGSCNRSSHFDNRTWTGDPTIPVADNSFHLVPSIAVPAPRRSLNYGAFLTPDPPYQRSNIDLPRRPGTSPPQQTSVPSERPRLLPSIARRPSEQTWKSYNSQFDRNQFPSAPSLNTCNFKGESSCAPQNPEPFRIQQQTRIQGQTQCEDNYTTENYRPTLVQPNNQPVTGNARVSPIPVQQPPVTSTRELAGVLKPGQPECATRASSIPPRKVALQQHTMQSKHSDPEQNRPIALMSQSEGMKERKSHPPQDLCFRPPIQIAPPRRERHSSASVTTRKRRYSQSNPDNVNVAKKRKAPTKDPEVTGAQSEQYQQHSPLTDRNDCGHFDADTWISGDIADQSVSQDNPQAQVRPQGEFMMPSLGEPVDFTCERSYEHAPLLGSSQCSPSDGGPMPPTVLDGSLPGPQPVGQGEGTHFLHFMNWDPSVHILLDQTPAFLEVAAGSRVPEEFKAETSQLERLAPELVSARDFFWADRVPNNPSEFDQFLLDYHHWGISSAVA